MAPLLRQHSFERLPAVLQRTQEYIIGADVWYGCDEIAERVIGPALVDQFDQALALLAPWRTHENRWVRRALGVGGHVWAKRAHGASQHSEKASRLLDFLQPLFLEQEMDAVKGIGWALKTLGRYYPNLLAPWLAQQLSQGRAPRCCARCSLIYPPKAAKNRKSRWLRES